MKTKTNSGARLEKILETYFPDRKLLRVSFIISVLAGIVIALIIFFPLDDSGSNAIIYGATGAWAIFGGQISKQRKDLIAFDVVNLIIAILIIFLLGIFGSGYVCGMIMISAILIAILSGSGIFLKKS